MIKKPWFGGIFSAHIAASPGQLQARADGSGPEAQNNLGAMLSNTGSQAAAAVSYRKAAEGGNAMAQSNLAMMYATGEGVARDQAQATRWFERSAAQGNAAAQFYLGDRCFRASLKLPNADATEALIEAFKWLQLASASGYPNAEVCRERVNLQMSREAVAEGNRRITAFVPTLEDSAN